MRPPRGLSQRPWCLSFATALRLLRFAERLPHTAERAMTLPTRRYLGDGLDVEMTGVDDVGIARVLWLIKGNGDRVWMSADTVRALLAYVEEVGFAVNTQPGEGTAK